jgi:hypothetical protein
VSGGSTVRKHPALLDRHVLDAEWMLRNFGIAVLSSAIFPLGGTARARGVDPPCPFELLGLRRYQLASAAPFHAGPPYFQGCGSYRLGHTLGNGELRGR